MPEPPSDLGRFQHAFAAALAGDADALAGLGLDAGAPGLSVYRNTIARGTIDALAVSHPTVLRLVGDEWFEAAARAFVAVHPPRERALVGYGEALAAFLETFGPAAGLPYLAGVARLDWLWLQAHTAPDAPAWTPAEAARTAPAALFDLRLALHPSARLAWFGTLAIPTLWRLSRPPAPGLARFDLATEPEGVLIVRPHGAVETLILERPAWALLDACGSGLSLGRAVDAALAADPTADVAATLARLVEAGAFLPPGPAG